MLNPIGLFSALTEWDRTHSTVKPAEKLEGKSWEELKKLGFGTTLYFYCDRADNNKWKIKDIRSCCPLCLNLSIRLYRVARWFFCCISFCVNFNNTVLVGNDRKILRLFKNNVDRLANNQSIAQALSERDRTAAEREQEKKGEELKNKRAEERKLTFEERELRKKELRDHYIQFLPQAAFTFCHPPLLSNYLEKLIYHDTLKKELDAYRELFKRKIKLLEHLAKRKKENADRIENVEKSIKHSEEFLRFGEALYAQILTQLALPAMPIIDLKNSNLSTLDAHRKYLEVLRASINLDELLKVKGIFLSLFGDYSQVPFIDPLYFRQIEIGINAYAVFTAKISEVETIIKELRDRSIISASIVS